MKGQFGLMRMNQIQVISGHSMSENSWDSATYPMIVGASSLSPSQEELVMQHAVEVLTALQYGSLHLSAQPTPCMRLVRLVESLAGQQWRSAAGL